MSVELEYYLVHRISQYLSFIDTPLTILKEYEINITVPKSSVDVYRANSYQGRAWLAAVHGIVAADWDFLFNLHKTVLKLASLHFRFISTFLFLIKRLFRFQMDPCL
jgi:hypothetical protein